MKYILPLGCGPVSHAGKGLTIAADRTVDLDSTVVALLMPHGIVPVGDPAPIDLSTVDGLSATSLAAALDARGIAHVSSASIATLRGLLRQALAKPRQ